MEGGGREEREGGREGGRGREGWRREEKEGGRERRQRGIATHQSLVLLFFKLSLNAVVDSLQLLLSLHQLLHLHHTHKQKSHTHHSEWLPHM